MCSKIAQALDVPSVHLKLTCQKSLHLPLKSWSNALQDVAKTDCVQDRILLGAFPSQECLLWHTTDLKQPCRMLLGSIGFPFRFASAESGCAAANLLKGSSRQMPGRSPGPSQFPQAAFQARHQILTRMTQQKTHQITRTHLSQTLTTETLCESQRLPNLTVQATGPRAGGRLSAGWTKRTPPQKLPGGLHQVLSQSSLEGMHVVHAGVSVTSWLSRAD